MSTPLRRLAGLGLGELLAAQAEQKPDARFLRLGADSLSYGDTVLRVTHIAAGLTNLGVARGDTVSIMLPNSVEFVLTSLAVSWLGAVEVPVNTAYRGEFLRYQIDDAESATVVVHSQWLDRLAIELPGLPNVRTVVVVGPYPHGIPIADRIELLSFDNLLLETPEHSSSAAMVAPGDPSAIMYTSGTTGRSKGVVVTNGHAVAFARDWIDAVGFTSEDTLLSPLPLFHTIARTLGVLPTLLLGAEMVLVERFSASNFWDDARAAGATVVHGVFGMVPILLGQPRRADDRDHQVRAYYLGSSALAEEFEARFGVRVVEVYGATETGIVTCLPAGAKVRAGSCGKVNGGTFEIALVDDDDEPVPQGDVGEIVVRPRRPWTMMNEYHRQPEATVDAFRNLWFHTGDFGRADQDDFLFFVDRKSDSIRRRGENISSSEVEAAVNRHPVVLESAAIAVPSELSEDEVKVCLVLTDGAALNLVDFIGFCAENMPYFAVPRYVELMDELPKTANGKVQKFALRNAGNHGITDTTWDREKAGITVSR